MASIISDTFLARLQHDAVPLSAVDPFLRWGVAAYRHLWDLTTTDELLEGAFLAFQPEGAASSHEPADLRGPLRSYLDTAAAFVPERLRTELGDDAPPLPGDDANDPADRVYLCIRRVVDLIEDLDDADNDADARGITAPHPAGVVAVPVGGHSIAWVDPVSLAVVDVGGWLVGHALDEASRPERESDPRTAGMAIAVLAAVEFALGPPEDSVRTVATLGAAALLQLQRADALCAPRLGLIVTAAERRAAVEQARDALDALDQVALARIALALESLAATETAIKALPVPACRDLHAEVVAADRRTLDGYLVATADEAVLALTDAVRADVETMERGMAINAPGDDVAAEDAARALRDARRAAFTAAVIARRGQRARLSWVQARRRWEALVPPTAAVCGDRAAQAAAGVVPSPLTFDAALPPAPTGGSPA